jgi:acyl carrier protein
MTGSKELLALIRSCMESIQILSGRSWREVSPDECPSDRLDGFDSYASVETTTEIEKRLGKKLTADTVFYNGKNALTLREVCDRVESLLATPT